MIGDILAQGDELEARLSFGLLLGVMIPGGHTRCGNVCGFALGQLAAWSFRHQSYEIRLTFCKSSMLSFS